MTEIPSVWLWISGAFFLVNLIFFAVLTGVLIYGVKLLGEMKPKVEALTGEVQALVQKVHTVADRVEEVAVSVKETVESVGGRARSVAGTTDIVVQTAGRQFERFSPYVVGALTAMRLVKGISDMRSSRKGGPDGKGKKKGGGLFSLMGSLLGK